MWEWSNKGRYDFFLRTHIYTFHSNPFSFDTFSKYDQEVMGYESVGIVLLVSLLLSL